METENGNNEKKECCRKKERSAEEYKNLIQRLNRIEGQIRGIRGMVEKDACCDDILIQISAVRSAINKVGSMMIEHYANNCMGVEKDSIEEARIKKLVKTINTFIK